jgi:uncharacterized protein
MRFFLDPAHPLFAMAHTGKHLTSPLRMVGLTLLFFCITALVAGGVLIGGMGVTLTGTLSASAFLVLLLLLVIWSGLTLLWMRIYEGRSPLTIGLAPERAVFRFMRGLLIGVGMFLIVVAVLGAAGGLEIGGGERPLTALLLLLGWIIQGSTEEIVFRGWVMTSLGARNSPFVGIVASSVMFGIMHSLNPNVTPLAVVNIILFGFFFAFLVLREGNLWGACGIHAVWNWIQANGFGLPVSGVTIPGGALLPLHINPDAPTWLTGGAFGPEGGLVVTTLLISLTALLIFLPHRKPQYPN